MGDAIATSGTPLERGRQFIPLAYIGKGKCYQNKMYSIILGTSCILPKIIDRSPTRFTWCHSVIVYGSRYMEKGVGLKGATGTYVVKTVVFEHVVAVLVSMPRMWGYVLCANASLQFCQCYHLQIVEQMAVLTVCDTDEGWQPCCTV